MTDKQQKQFLLSIDDEFDESCVSEDREILEEEIRNIIAEDINFDNHPKVFKIYELKLIQTKIK